MKPGEQDTAAAMAAPAPPPSSAKLLAASSSAGSGSSRASKRRSRATAKPPITVLSADKSTFRDMVQNLTGAPTLNNLRAPPDPSLLWRAINNLTQPLINARTWPAARPPVSSLPSTLDTNTSAVLNLLATLYSTSPNDPSIRSNSDLDLAAQAAYDQSHLSFLKSLQAATINSATPPSLLRDPMQPGTFPSTLDINSLLSDQDSFTSPPPPLGGGPPHASPHQSEEATAMGMASTTSSSSTTSTSTATATTNSFNLSLAEVEHRNKLRQAAELESLILFHKSKDSWASSDRQHAGVANIGQHSPSKMELAHSA